MKKRVLLLTGLSLILGSYLPGTAYAQAYPIGAGIGLVQAIKAQNDANKAIAEKTTTTETYRGQSFPMKRTPADILIGDATDRIELVENQLSLCHAVLLADSINDTCPSERQAIIRNTMKYLALARSNWDTQAYYKEMKFYLAEDVRRRRANR